MTFFFLTIACLLVQALFAMFEMASVSFNKVRLQYYATLGRGKALERLLKRPSRLFGTTLIGLNAALQLGSECGRRFYEEMGLNPDWAPISQVVIVLIFAELAPLIAARRHPEPIAMGLAPFMSFISYLLLPFIAFFGFLQRMLVGKSEEMSFLLNREEVQKAFETGREAEEREAPLAQIFRLKEMQAKALAVPLMAISASTTVKELRKAKRKGVIPLFSGKSDQIVGMIEQRDLIHEGPHEMAIKRAAAPWFVPAETSVTALLEQFRKNNESAAIVLSSEGKALGLVTLDAIIDQIFGKEVEGKQEATLFVERKLMGSITVKQFNSELHASLPFQIDETMSEFLTKVAGHYPVKEEVIEYEGYEFTVIEPAFRGVKQFFVRTK